MAIIIITTVYVLCVCEGGGGRKCEFESICVSLDQLCDIELMVHQN